MPKMEGTRKLVQGVFISVIAGLAVMTGAHAQQGEAPMAGQELTTAKLEAFASAFVETSEIFDAYESRLSKAGNPERANALQQEANEKMKQAIEEKGLTVKEYNVIFNTVRTDEDLKDQVNELIRQKR